MTIYSRVVVNIPRVKLGGIPLYFAVRENHVNVVRFLLAAGANLVGLMLQAKGRMRSRI